MRGISTKEFESQIEANSAVFAKAVASAMGHGMSDSNVKIEQVKQYKGDIEVFYKVSYSADELLFTAEKDSIQTLADCLITSVFNGGFNSYLQSISASSSGISNRKLDKCRAWAVVVDLKQ